MTNQYKQIGNAVPINLAFAIGRLLIRLFNEIDAQYPEESQYEEADRIGHSMLPPKLFPVDMFDVQKDFLEGIVTNAYVKQKGG